MSYHLEYVDKPDKFDEVVEQDGVRVIIDSKALFSIIGSEMDWQEDALQARFVFKSVFHSITSAVPDRTDLLRWLDRPEYQGCLRLWRVSSCPLASSSDHSQAS
jgi:hypothetical protein